MIHGFGGGCYTFYKQISYLIEHFNIILLDIPGMGFNSRQEKLKDFKTWEDFMDYYIVTLNSFFEKLDLKEFHLAGHSLGAYISTFYFEKYPQKIKKLILLSPAGFNPVDD